MQEVAFPQDRSRLISEPSSCGGPRASVWTTCREAHAGGGHALVAVLPNICDLLEFQSR